MILIIIILLLGWNLFCSAFNAWSVGRCWAETKEMGGVPRFMAWCGAIMSGAGFTWCYLIIFYLVDQCAPVKYQLPHKYLEGMLALGYLFVILPIIGIGIAITIQSWAYFWKERSFKNGAVAGYNTFADVYNIYEAMEGIPESFSILKGLVNSKDNDNDEDGNFWFELMIALVILAILGGALTTAFIIRSTARSVARDERLRIMEARVISNSRN